MKVIAHRQSSSSLFAPRVLSLGGSRARIFGKLGPTYDVVFAGLSMCTACSRNTSPGAFSPANESRDYKITAGTLNGTWTYITAAGAACCVDKSGAGGPTLEVYNTSNTTCGGGVAQTVSAFASRLGFDPTNQRVFLDAWMSTAGGSRLLYLFHGNIDFCDVDTTIVIPNELTTCGFNAATGSHTFGRTSVTAAAFGGDATIVLCP